MNYGISDILTLIGALGVFLYGMKLMSEALQKVAGNRMKNILSAMTSNRFAGVLTGLLITTIIQSSSATTVMVVSFVNAGLLNLVQSIGVVMGANIGTTITAWMVSILGFKVSMAAISLPLIGISLPFLFSSKRILKSWGELLVGFGLLFIGLDFLKDSMPELAADSPLLTGLSNISGYGYGSYLIFILIGTLLTVLLQSSSATMALTLVMCAQGLISFEVAAAVVLGENIGTTITANLAAMMANTTAKRTALSHLVFNIFGVLWMLLIFPFALKGIANLNISLGLGNPATNPEAVTTSLSLFHTLFNLINVCILVWFVNFIAKVVCVILPKKATDDEEFSLKHIKIGMISSTPSTSLYLAKQEISLYGGDVRSMFARARSCMNLNSTELEKSFDKISNLETECDNVEVEIAHFLTRVSESKLSTEDSQQLRAMYTIVSEIESVADSAFNIAKTFKRKDEQKITFSDELTKNLNNILDMTDEVIQCMVTNLERDYRVANAKRAYDLEKRLNEYRAILKQENVSDVKEKKYDYTTSVVYCDIFNECEKLGDYAINVTQAIKEITQND